VQGICSYSVLMDIENLADVWEAGGRLYARCEKPRREAMKSVRPCGHKEELNLRTLLWTRVPAYNAGGLGGTAWLASPRPAPSAAPAARRLWMEMLCIRILPPSDKFRLPDDAEQEEHDQHHHDDAGDQIWRHTTADEARWKAGDGKHDQDDQQNVETGKHGGFPLWLIGFLVCGFDEGFPLWAALGFGKFNRPSTRSGVLAPLATIVGAA
jgi:hypothetical protein